MEFSKPRIAQKRAIHTAHLWRKLGMYPNQKRIVLTPYSPMNYRPFGLQVMSKVKDAVLVVIGDVENAYSVENRLMGYLYRNDEDLYINTPYYDRYVKHLPQLTDLDRLRLIEMADLIVLPDTAYPLRSSSNDFVLSALLQSKTIITQKEAYEHSIYLRSNNSVGIEKGNINQWINHISEFLEYPEDAIDFGYIAKTNTKKWLRAEGETLLRESSDWFKYLLNNNMKVA